ncbi:MAG: excinuclease ABC subunit UvrA [Candidatus Eremiobacteraeota bacterium]|nr:excinuclease ABC subunit UvrA [Candidatus Eremiobacteraeota bacterium]
MATDSIIIRGAREHNLKNIDLELPRNRLIVITGISGSGKSTLAFDTIYAEGQRRYVESLSAYARQFLGRMDKPDVDYIEGLSPAISIDQKGASRNPRSTVGTVTEIYDYLRLLYARIGVPHCPQCGREISVMTVQQIVDRVMLIPPGTRFMILSPLVRGRKGEYHKLIAGIAGKGFTRVRVDGSLYEVNEEIDLDKNRKHTIEVVVDRLVMKDGVKGRLAESVEASLALSEGLVIVQLSDGDEWLFSEKLSCPQCEISLEDLQPRLFSFNSPYGACPECSGIGTRLELDPDMLVPDRSRSIEEGAIVPWGKPVRSFRHMPRESWFWERFYEAAGREGIRFEVPFARLSPEQQQFVFYGTGGRTGHNGHFEGAIPNLRRRYLETESEYIRSTIEKYMARTPCPACRGSRLKREAMAVTVGGKNIASLTEFTVKEAKHFFASLVLSPREEVIARQIFKEIKARLSFLSDVGLEYLTINRGAATLAGGEAQRIRLATQIGSSLVGVLYVLDEPSIGLHQRDNRKLLSTLKALRDLGNTVIVVEHDDETIRSADFVVDIGPGAGVHGGEIVVTGSPGHVMKAPGSLTGRYLSGDLMIPMPASRRQPDHRVLAIRGAREHNLKNIDVTIPLGLFVCVTGVSGSGKSTLVDEILYRRLAQEFHGSSEKPGLHESLGGTEFVDKVIIIDQSPIGRTPRSNPATYTNAFTPIRELFSETKDARMRGYLPGRFSFNVKGGRCESCEGDGIIKIEMHFLPDVYVPCEVCKGKRYNRETLEVRFKGKNIADVLEMTVEEAHEYFINIPRIRKKLETLRDVGLGYIGLGQAATTLSGGEAQRIKLASELSRKATGKTLYILDEPTTGLHFHDVAKLLEVLSRLVDTGNTVIVIEHNLEVIKCADHIIDLGPEGGDAGGFVVASGTPEEVAGMESSHTGSYLRKYLEKAALPS